MKIQFKKEIYLVGVLLGLLFWSNPITAQTRSGVQTRNPQGVLHIDGKGDNPKTAGIPNNTQASNDIIITDQGKIGVGTIEPKAAVDLRSVANDNAFGLGTTTMSASQAQAGALRYEPNTKRLEYSDGVTWSASYTSPDKAAVIAQIVDDRSIPGDAFTTLNNWREDKDVTNSFNASTGVFTAPREGYYSVFLTYNFIMDWIIYGRRIEARIVSNTNGILASSKKTFNRTSRDTQAGALFHATVKLKANETIRIEIFQNIAKDINVGNFVFPKWVVGPRNLRTHTSQSNSNAGFNHISIVEH
ncbi:hypothetical protein ACYSNM_09835 [Myroides sp. LJL116]